MRSVQSSASESDLKQHHRKWRYFALPCAYYDAIAHMGLNSTDKKLLLAIIWFTLGWGKPTNAIALKSLRAFANISEKALYTSRKRLVALKLISVREQLPVRDTLGTRRQGHTDYTVLLARRPYEAVDYELVEAVAPELSGPELILLLVIMRKQSNGGFWFATVSQLSLLAGYSPTAIKNARNSLLLDGLIDGCRGLHDSPIVAGYRCPSSPSHADSYTWADLPHSDLWSHLREQLLKHTDSYLTPHLSGKEAAFLNNVYEQSPGDLLAATDSLTCRLAERGQLYLYKRKLMALANKLHCRSWD